MRQSYGQALRAFLPVLRSLPFPLLQLLPWRQPPFWWCGACGPQSSWPVPFLQRGQLQRKPPQQAPRPSLRHALRAPSPRQWSTAGHLRRTPPARSAARCQPQRPCQRCPRTCRRPRKSAGAQFLPGWAERSTSERCRPHPPTGAARCRWRCRSWSGPAACRMRGCGCGKRRHPRG